jgi:hypothetical protein
MIIFLKIFISILYQKMSCWPRQWVSLKSNILIWPTQYGPKRFDSVWPFPFQPNPWKVGRILSSFPPPSNTLLSPPEFTFFFCSFTFCSCVFIYMDSEISSFEKNNNKNSRIQIFLLQKIVPNSSRKKRNFTDMRETWKM